MQVILDFLFARPGSAPIGGKKVEFRDWTKDPGACFGKAIYRLHVYRRNPQDGYYFHQQNNDRIKANEDLALFLVALKRAVFNGPRKSSFIIFLIFTYMYEEEFTVSFISF